MEVSDAAGNATLDSQDVYFANGITANKTLQNNNISDYTITHSPGEKNASMINFTFFLPTKSDVAILIYDFNGREIGRIMSNNYSIGKHTFLWNGKDTKGNRLHSGMYLYSFEAGEYTVTKRLVYCK